MLGEQRFDRRQHPAGLSGIAAAGNAEVNVRLGKCQLLEEDLGKFAVVMLAGVHQNLFVALAQPRTDGCQLHELRTVSDDRQDLHTVR